MLDQELHLTSTTSSLSGSLDMTPSMALKGDSCSYIAKGDGPVFHSDDMSMHYQYNKTEEKELKKARRRIKNKLSAQESRKRKKEYIEGLEKRMRQKERDNIDLKETIYLLERRVKSLSTDLEAATGTTKSSNVAMATNPRFPVLVRTISRSTQTGVCLSCYENRHCSTGDDPEVSPIDQRPRFDRMVSFPSPQCFKYEQESHRTIAAGTTASRRRLLGRPMSLDLEYSSFTRLKSEREEEEASVPHFQSHGLKIDPHVGEMTSGGGSSI